MLAGKNIYLRAAEPSDIEFLYALENDANIWQSGLINQPISKFTLKAYLQNAHQTLDEAGQMRLIICRNGATQPLGALDLFDYDARNQRAAVGIALAENVRGKGFATEAIEIVKDYAKNHLLLHQLYCHSAVDNLASVALFRKCGFAKVGILTHWLRNANGFAPAILWQCIL